MARGPEELYEEWIRLYDEGDPVRAMRLTAPDFVMVTPDQQKHGREAAVELTRQIKAQVERLGLRRKTTIKSLHTAPAGEGRWVIYATLDLLFTTPAGMETHLPFVEVIVTGPDGISFDAFSKLSDSQDMF